MAFKGFRYQPDIQSTLSPWRAKLGENYEQVVALLTDRDRQLEDYVNRPQTGAVVTVVSYQAVSGSATYAGGSGFTDYPGPHDITIVKKYDSATSKLVVFGTVGVFKGSNTGAALIGLKFGGTDHTIGTFFFNTLSEHGLVHCQDDTFSGLGAGTLVGRVRWDTPITSVNADANDAVRLTILEVML